MQEVQPNGNLKEDLIKATYIALILCMQASQGLHQVNRPTVPKYERKYIYAEKHIVFDRQIFYETRYEDATSKQCIETTLNVGLTLDVHKTAHR